MTSSELDRIGEIDRSEHITQQYRSRDGVLELVDVDVHASRWGGPREHPVQYYIDKWRPILEAGGVLLGAFDDDRLIGFAIYEPPGGDDFAKLAVLHVTSAHRRTGVGHRLTDEVVRLARADEVRRLYVSATPTRATVDFYMREGFEPLVTPDPKLFTLEPDDIHLERRL